MGIGMSCNSRIVFSKARIKAIVHQLCSKSLIGHLVLLEICHVCVMALSLLPDPKEI